MGGQCSKHGGLRLGAQGGAGGVVEVGSHKIIQMMFLVLDLDAEVACGGDGGGAGEAGELAIHHHLEGGLVHEGFDVFAQTRPEVVRVAFGAVDAALAFFGTVGVGHFAAAGDVDHFIDGVDDLGEGDLGEWARDDIAAAGAAGAADDVGFA